MSMAIDGSAGANAVNASIGGAQRSMARISSSSSSPVSGGGDPAVNVKISVALLRRSREINSELASELIATLPKVQ